MPRHKLLLASPVQPIGGCSPNVYGWDKRPAHVRIAMSFLSHPGLAFLGANLPCDVLEYPDERAFAESLRDPPEVLGISFYINETSIALRMMDDARRAGVREVWAGNYGAYTPEVAAKFDRTFTGWGERQLASAIGVELPVSGLVHPEMYGAIGTNIFPRMMLSGLLFTSRGCPWTCSFCQTPQFYGKPQEISLEAIDRVLWTYKSRGVRGINILDENFGTFRGHADEVVDLLHRYRFRWIALTRVDTLLKSFDRWASKGLFGAHLGVESLNQSSLSGAGKRIQQNDSVKLLHSMSRHHMFVQAFYILGFEQDTTSSIRADVDMLATLDVDLVQVQVLTPYPQTRERETIARQFGIHDQELTHYNSRHLVWNHPNISLTEMRELQRYANTKLASSRRALRTLAKFAVFGGQPQVSTRGLSLVAATVGGKASALHRRYSASLASARSWSRVGWYSYEEGASAASAAEFALRPQ
ncbi:MAG TPA: radical SAM protein [Gemmatimonadaceae bacterium]